MAASKGRKTATGPKPLYAIFGTDTFLKSQALRRVLTEVLGPDPDPMAIVELEGANARLADVLDELRTPSLLTPIRVVIVRDADIFITGRQKAGDKDDQDDDADDSDSAVPSGCRKGVEKYFESESPSGVLVLMLRSWPSNTRLYKIADAIGQNIGCGAPKNGATAWAVDWAASWANAVHGCELSRPTAVRLVELAGVDCGRLDSELSKLAAYIHPRKQIALADVDALVGSRREETIFALGDALGRRDSAAALDLWQQVIATDRAAPYRALGGLAWGFRRCVQGRRLLDDGVPPGVAANRSGFYGNPDLLRRQVGTLSVRQWEDILTRLLRIDVSTKTGLGATELAVEKLIVQICGEPAAKDRK